MKKNKYFIILAVIATLLVVPQWCLGQEEQKNLTGYGELEDRTVLYEVVLHLYRWYLDETDAQKIVGQNTCIFHVRPLNVALDPGDKSLFGSIVLPQLGVSVVMKKADYAIQELDLVVKSDGFKIINVARDLSESNENFNEIKLNYADIRDFAFRNRNLSRFPDENLLMRMRLSARGQILKYLEDREKAGLPNRIGTVSELFKKEQILHLSPLSKVANEMWVFWETGRMLIRFSSDLDLENPALWDHDDLAVDIYNIDEQTVVSLDEVAGSNAYMTRDQVGRILFNCIVLGKRLVIETLTAEEVEAAKKKAVLQ